MADNKESFQESVMIRRAKIRQIGAVIILIILFFLSVFFLQDRTNINFKNPIKISFLETNNEFIINSDSFKLQNLSKIQPKEKYQLEKTNVSQALSADENPYFIQVGIFSNEVNASRLLGTIRSLGYGGRLEMITMYGKNKLKLTTTEFNSKKEAQTALSIFKRANLPGIIKRK